jgi:hypothetical protein
MAPTRHHLTVVARQLRSSLKAPFQTIERSEVTRMIRETSGEDTTRLKTGKMAEDLERALLEQGIRCFPSLRDTTTGDTIRLFPAGSALGNLTDLLMHPSRETDEELKEVLSKLD